MYKGGQIKEITFSDGSVMTIEPNDIVVFVGPNNVGKTQSLRDLYNSTFYPDADGLLVSNIEQEFPSSTQIFEDINKFLKLDPNYGMGSYSGYNVHISGYEIERFSKGDFERDTAIKNLYISMSGTENRLKAVAPVESVSQSATWSHPLHYVINDADLRKRLSSYFEKAFGKELIGNIYNGSTCSLSIGSIQTFSEEFEDETDRADYYRKSVLALPLVHEQGDGIKSFVGIALDLVLEQYNVSLLDEPESFLHPPQARVMGELIADISDGARQIFISTHSCDLIQGLLNVAHERVRLVRITRDSNTNSFNILSNEDIHHIWRDAFLKYSSVLNCIFYDTTVLCESESDCKFYSLVAQSINPASTTCSSVLFAHCGGKARMPAVCSSLGKLGVNLKVIGDFDVLNDVKFVKELVNSCGGDYQVMAQDHKVFLDQIRQMRHHMPRKSDFDNALATMEETLTESNVNQLREILKYDRPWDALKRGGESALPQGDAPAKYEAISRYLKSLGIYLVPVGELERFVPSEGGHGPEWVNSVLEKYQDFSDGHYDIARSFISSLGLIGD